MLLSLPPKLFIIKNSTPMKKHFITRALLATAIVFLTAATSFGQCVIPVTDGQPYIEDFEGDGFDCWTVEPNGGNWTLLDGTNSNVASFSYENNGDEALLISPTLDMSAISGATFSFSYAMMGIFEYDVLEVSYRSSESDAWHVLGTYSLSDYENIYEETFELENLSATYQISFLGRGLGGMYIFVDNIEITSTMGCARPVNLHASEITRFSALLNWSTMGNEESWTIDLNGSMIEVTEQPYLMEDLRPETDYTFSVRANCGDGNTSEWATPVTFSTLCDVLVVTDEDPFIDDFEASDDFVCWQNEIISGTDPWVVDPGYVILNNTAFFIWLGGDAMLISPMMDLTAVTKPTLTFRHKQLLGVNGTIDELVIGYRTNENSDWQALAEFPTATTDWETVVLELPEPSATYQIAFEGIAHDAEGIYVDDVRVGNSDDVGVGEAMAVVASVSPNPTSGLVQVEANVSDGEVAVFDLFGKQVAEAAVKGGQAEIDLRHCAQGVYVARISSANGMTVVKVVKE